MLNQLLLGGVELGLINRGGHLILCAHYLATGWNLECGAHPVPKKKQKQIT